MTTEQAFKEALARRDAARAEIMARSMHVDLVDPVESYVKAMLRLSTLKEQVAANHGLTKPTLEEALRG